MKIAIIGGGPAGLMAAEAALAGGAHVALYDSMASVGRKFLLAGKGGLNLTHSDQPVWRAPRAGRALVGRVRGRCDSHVGARAWCRDVCRLLRSCVSDGYEGCTAAARLVTAVASGGIDDSCAASLAWLG